MLFQKREERSPSITWSDLHGSAIAYNVMMCNVDKIKLESAFDARTIEVGRVSATFDGKRTLDFGNFLYGGLNLVCAGWLKETGRCSVPLRTIPIFKLGMLES
jgi:hypothetical protein